MLTERAPDTVRGADVLFIAKERLAGKQPTGFLETAPDLVVEFISRDLLPGDDVLPGFSVPVARFFR